LLLLLAGCGATERMIESSIPQDDYQIRHPIVLGEEPRTLEILVEPVTGQFDRHSAAQLREFASLYRELMARGISEYLVAPFNVLDFIRAISHLYASAGATPVGKIVAITGAKGGTGASSIAHNIAFSIARDLDIQTIVVDMDLGFGTAGLDFNQDPTQGIAEAVFAPDRIDQNLVDRLLSKCGEKLSILAAPATLDRMYDFPETAFDSLIDILRATTPCVILDIPHIWTAWARRALINADEIGIVASPDLAICATPKTCSICCARRGRMMGIRSLL
jgi:pilus assembly protein CpaE